MVPLLILHFPRNMVQIVLKAQKQIQTQLNASSSPSHIKPIFLMHFYYT